MAQTQVQKFTFADFLDYDAEEGRMELEDGEIIIMPTASPLHTQIIRFLFTMIEQYIKSHHLELEIFPGGIGVRTGIRTSREPDLCILHREDWTALLKQNPKSAIVERPPLLVIEVVNPGNTNRERDYDKKQQEYAEMSIPEYWIVAPDEQKVVVCLLTGQAYHVTAYQGQSTIQSNLLPELVMTIEQLFNF